MRIHRGLLAFAVLTVLGASAAAGAVTAPGQSPSRLRAFDGCPSFVAYVRKQTLPLVGPWGLGGGVVGIGATVPPGAARDAVSGAPGADSEFSGTNVQEEGVDEPDLVKTDGRTLFVVTDARVSAFDVRSRRPRLVGSLKLEKGWAHELLLDRGRLLVLSQGSPRPLPIDGDIAIRAPWPYPSRSVIAEVDASDPRRLRVVRTLELDGGYLTARLAGHVARIVVSSPIGIELPFVAPSGAGAVDAARAAEQNRAVVRAAGARSWLPGRTLRNGSGRAVSKGPLVQCRDVTRPSRFSGLGLLTVLTVDVARGLDPIDSDAIVSDGRVVYASRSSLYVATDRYDGRTADGRPGGTGAATAIHRFDISSPRRTDYRASGSVPGVLLNQWSLSEWKGTLRVASTEQPVWWGGSRTESETTVTTLGQEGSELVRLGRVGGLGKGERVYAVRFIGDVAYVVTFRQVDPLYTLDLSVPTRPAVRGELKIRGYSAYLHPVGDDLLLGIGQDATDDGRVVGAQASLFDISDLRHPARLDAFALGKGWSEAESEHHAFLWWPRTRLAVIPLQEYADKPFVGALGLRVGRVGGISEAGRVSHPAAAGVEPVGSPGTPVRRSVVVGDVLYTISALGVKATSLASFADFGFARLPQESAGVTPPQPSR
jgi:hypothetical protein